MTARRIGSATLVLIALALQGLGKYTKQSIPFAIARLTQSPKRLFKILLGSKARGRGLPLEGSVRRFGANLLLTR
jgi:hypothetical protein